MEQTYMLSMLSILYCEYHVRWCPGDLSREGISRHGIDQINHIIPFLASEEWTLICVSIIVRLGMTSGIMQSNYKDNDFIYGPGWWQLHAGTYFTKRGSSYHHRI